jgi:hypothetical protein
MAKTVFPETRSFSIQALNSPHELRPGFPLYAFENPMGQVSRVEDQEHLLGSACEGRFHGVYQPALAFIVPFGWLQEGDLHISTLGSSPHLYAIREVTQFWGRGCSEQMPTRAPPEFLSQQLKTPFEMGKVAQHESVEKVCFIQNELVHECQAVDQQAAILHVLAEEPIDLIRGCQDDRFVQGGHQLSARHSALQLAYPQAGDLCQGIHHPPLVFHQGNSRVHQ